MRIRISRRAALISLAAIFVVIAFLVTLRAMRGGAAELFDPSVAEPPADVAAARKELKSMKSVLAKMKPRSPYIVVDSHSNRIYLRTADKIILESKCSTGSGGEYIDGETGRHWIFNTPRGVFKINSKMTEPWWRKPDWAFLEEGEEIPENEEERYDPEMMGDYALGFGNGYFIHGTIYERLLGISVTHGCVRVGSEDLKKLFSSVPLGTAVYIF